MGLPFRSCDGGRGGEHRDGSGFVAVAPFLVHGLHARLWLGRGADGLDLLPEDRLVLLELDDQMCVGRLTQIQTFSARGILQLPLRLRTLNRVAFGTQYSALNSPGGLLFHRLAQQAVAVSPAPYKSIIGGSPPRPA